MVILEDKPSIFKVELKHEDLYYSTVNKLRRVIHNEIPKVAIENVIFHKSVLFYTNRVILDRLKLIPIESKTGNGTITLNVRNDTNDIKGVYSNELQFENPDGKSVFDDILLFKMRPNDEADVEMYFQEEKTAKDAGAFYKTTSNCSYTYEKPLGKFIFTVESISEQGSRELFEKGVSILKEKHNITLSFSN